MKLILHNKGIIEGTPKEIKEFLELDAKVDTCQRHENNISINKEIEDMSADDKRDDSYARLYIKSYLFD